MRLRSERNADGHQQYDDRRYISENECNRGTDYGCERCPNEASHGCDAFLRGLL